MVSTVLDSLPHGAATAHGIDRKDVLRVRKAGPIGPDSIDELRRQLNLADPEARLPPPIVKVSSREQFMWIELGRRLLAASPSRFRSVMAELEKIIAGVEAERAMNVSEDPDDDD